MSDIQIFQNSEFGELDILIDSDGNVLFPATECARVLGYAKPQNAIARHCKRGTTKRGGVSCTTNQHGVTTEQYVEKNYIYEGDLYRLIVNSRLESAQRFETWVFDEVLPSIHKHGGYLTPEKLEEAILNPDVLIDLATALKTERERNMALKLSDKDLTKENQAMLPKAEYFDELVDRNLLTNFRETAKELKVKEKSFISFLFDNSYIYRDKKGKIMPYAYKNEGLFEVKECFDEKTNWSGVQTLITPKGRETFRMLMTRIYPKEQGILSNLSP